MALEGTWGILSFGCQKRCLQNPGASAASQDTTARATRVQLGLMEESDWWTPAVPRFPVFWVVHHFLNTKSEPQILNLDKLNSSQKKSWTLHDLFIIIHYSFWFKLFMILNHESFEISWIMKSLLIHFKSWIMNYSYLIFDSNSFHKLCLWHPDQGTLIIPTQISPMYKLIALVEIIPGVNVHQIFAVRDYLKWFVFVGLIHHLYLDGR